MNVPSPRFVFRIRGTLALLLGATLWAAFGGAAPLAAQPVLVINSITHAPASVVAGSATDVVYTLDLRNTATGTSDDETAAVLDLPLGSALTYQSETLPSATCSVVAGPTMRCLLGSMQENTTRTGTISLRVAASVAAGTLTGNFSFYGTVDTSPDLQSEDVTVTTAAALVVDKVAPSPNKIVPGNSVVYTVSVTNNGPSDATNVVLADPIPAGFGTRTYSGDCAASPCNLGTIVPAAIKNITVTFTVPDNYHLVTVTSPVVNTATATTDTPNSGSSVYSDSVSSPVEPQVDLSVVLSSAATSVTPGQAASYQIVVSKTGPSRLDRVHITGALSLLGAVFTPSEGIFSATSISPDWIGLDLAGSDSATLTFSGWVSPAQPGATLAASVTVAVPAGVTDTNSGNDSDTESDTISRLSDLSIVKTNNLNGLIPGQAVPYTISVTNHGPSDIAAATVVDNFDASRVSTVSWSCSTARVLTDLGQLVDGAGGVDGLDGASAVVATPDGKHVYASAAADNSVTLFVRDATTGLLSFGAVYADGTAASAIAGASALAVSPDGGQIYVTGASDNGLEVFTRTAATGVLVSLETEVNGTAGVTGMTGPKGVAVAPDGRHVYVAAATGSAVVVFNRNLTTGSLTWNSTVTGASGIGGARAVAVSPDGRHVLVAGESANGVAVFARNLTTGVLTFVEAQIDGAGGVDGLGGASALAFSPAGDAVYVAGFSDNAVAVFSRSAVTGHLGYLEHETDGAGSPLVDGLAGARGVVVSPDGSLVFVAGATDGKIAVFSRNSSGLQIHKIDFLDIAGLGSAVGLAITPAGEQVYGVGSTADALGMFSETRATAACTVPVGSNLTFSEAVAIPAQGSVSYTAASVLSNSASGTLVNTATVSALAGVDTNAANNSSTDSDPIGLEADITVTKTANPVAAVPGESVVYTLAVTNAGPASVSGASVTDSGLTSSDYSAVSWTCVGQGGAVCGSPASGSGNISHAGNVNLPAGGTVTYTINVTIATNAVGTACTLPLTGNCAKNSASATMPATYIDPSPLDHTASVEVPISPKAELSISKTVLTPLGAIAAGAPLSFQVQVRNCGPSNVTGALVQDNFAADYVGTGFPGAPAAPTWTCTATNGSCPASGSGNLNAAVSLNGGNPANCAGAGQATFTILGKVVASPSSGVLSNVAKVVVPSGVFDPSVGNNTASVQVVLKAATDVAIIKTDGTTVATPGEPITYSITVFNTGPDDAQALSVMDDFPAALRNVSWTCNSEAPALGTLTFLEEQRQNATVPAGLLTGLGGTRDVAVSPDPDGAGPAAGGTFVYATGATEGALTTFHRTAADGALTYLGRLLDGATQGFLTVDGLAGANGLTLSPDGLNIYVAAETEDKVGVFTRSPATGLPTFIEAVAEGDVQTSGTVDGLDGAQDLALSPDGKHLYVVSPLEDAVTVFARDASLSGRLAWVEVKKDGVGGIDGLDGASSVRVSPDGNHVYVTGVDDDAVAVFSRETSSVSANFGKLTFLQVLKDGVGGITHMDGAAGIDLSPDGAFAYVAAGAADDAVSVFSRNTTSGDALNFGKLTYLSERHEGELSGLGGAASGLDGARRVVVSPDGQHVYVASQDSDAVVVFQRNPATGSLKFIGVHRDETTAACVQPISCTIHSLDGAGALAVDPAGDNLYVAAQNDSSLSVFVRAGAPPSFAFAGGQPGSNPPAPVKNGVGGVSGLNAVTDVGVTGEHLYAVSFGDGVDRGSIVAFSRDAATGDLNFVNRLQDGTGGVDGLDGASALAIYDDNVYVVSQSLVEGDNAIAVFKRNTVSGAVTFLELHRQGQFGVSGLFGASDVAVSSDGSHVYVAGRTPGSLAVFSRDAGNDGRLTFREAKIAGSGGIVGLQGAQGVALSSDDRHVYVTASVNDDVAVFARNANNGDFANFGRVTEIQVVDGIPGLDRAMGIAVSNDPTDTDGSRNVYVTGHTADALSVFERNVESASDDFGKLTLIQGFKDGTAGVDGINGARAVAVSPDGKNVYVAGEDDDAVAVFAREATGGTLVFVEAAFDGQNGVDGIDQSYGLAVSANSRETYVAGFGDDAIALFRRASGSRCTGAGVGTLADTGVEIAAGGQVVYTVKATIDPGATGQLVNEAHVIVPVAIQEPGPDSTGLHQAGVCTDNSVAPPITNNNGCRDIDTLVPRTDLAVDKTDHDDVAVPGSEITYTITVRNDGPSNVVGALVHDDLTNIFPTGATWTCVAAPSGTLTFLGDYVEGEVLPGPQTVSGLVGAKAVAVSPDGEHVYATGLGGDSLAAFSLDGTAGTLAFVASYVDGVAGVDGLNGATDVLVSPDGKNVYVAGQVDDAVAVFTRDANPLSPTFGALTFFELQQSPGVAGLDEPVALAMDPSGDSLYVAAANSNAITVFDRNAATGALTFLETLVDGVGSVEGLAGASSVAVSFDGEWVYATGENDDALVVFDRNPATGALTFAQNKVDGVGGVDGLAVPRSVVVSPDDLNVYVAGSGDNAIAVFTRDLPAGTLTFRQVVRDGVGGADGIAGVSALAVSGDGGLGFHLYAAGSAENALGIFRRDASDFGKLTFVDAERDGFGSVNGLAGAADVALSPEGASVVVAGPVDDALALFRRPTDSSCSSGSDFPAFPPPPLPGLPDPIILDDVVNIAAHSKVVYRVTGQVDPELCQVYPCTAVDLVNTATASAGSDTNAANNSDVDTDDLSPRADLEITKTDHISVLQGLAGASALAASPDGTAVYATGLIGDGVAAFTRTPATGALTFVESERDSVAGVDGLNGAAAVLVSGDGAQVYVAGSADNAVVAFSRDAATNELTLLELERNGFGGVTGLLGPDGLALSSDGKHLYAAAAGSSSVAIFERDTNAASPTFGKLGFLGEVRDGVSGVDGLNLARGLALSPDDAHLYVVGEADNAVAVFARNVASGALTFVQFLSDGVAGVSGLAGPRGVAVSPDGGQVYVASGTGNAVALFAREASNASADFGKLTFVAAYVDGVGGVDGLRGAAAILVSPDPVGSDPGGQHVYVAGSGEDAVAVFTRDAITGALTFTGAARQGQAGVSDLSGPVALLASADAQNVYAAAAGDDAVVTFDRDWDSGTLAGTGALAFVESDANGDGTVAPGETISYDIVVTNHGPSGVRGALVTDVFPGELENVEWECFSQALGATCLNGSSGVGDLVDKQVRLPAGSQLLITAAGTIKPGVTGTIVNTATVAAPNGFIELAPANNTATDGDTELERKADLAIDKIACSDPLDCAATAVAELVPGTTIHYEIRVDNHGLSDVQGATVSDVLPELLADAVWSCVAAPVPGLLSPLSGWAPVPPSPLFAAVHDGDDMPDISRSCSLPPLTLVNGLDGARAVAVSPDGLNVYVAGANDNAVAIFRRDLRNGSVKYTGLVVDGEPVRDAGCTVTGAVDGLLGASDVEVSGDGLHVYVTGELDDAVAVFDRQAVTGNLKFKQFLRDGVAGVNGLGNVRGAALSPDGKHLYTAARSDNGVGIFARSAATGQLTYLGIRVDGSPQPPLTIDGLAGASAVAVSPDGAHVYVVGETDDAVAVFSRDATTGLLTFVEAKKDGLSGVDGLNGARALALSDDGRHLYVAGALDNAVAVFSRNATTGALTFVEAQVDGAGGADGLAGAAGVALSPDGEHVYVAGEGDSAVAVLARNPLTGALTPLPASFDGVAGIDGLGGVRAVVVSPDGEQVYGAGAGEDALALMRRGDGSRCTPTGFGSIADTVDITAGGSVVYALSAELSPAATGTLLNTARVTEPANVIDAAQGNNVVVHGAQLTPEVDLTLTKDDGQTEAIPGLPVTYTITLSNAGPSDLADGALEDLFPAIFEDPAWSCVATSAVAFVEAELNGVGGVSGLDAPQSVVIAPDPDGAFGPLTGGDFVYVSARASNAIDLFARDTGTGELAFVASYVDGTGGLDGFGGAAGLAISPDGKNLYAAGATDDAIAVFARNPASGVLTAVEVQRESDPVVDGLDGATAVAVSPDGSHVYVASADDDALAVFARTADTGALTFVMRAKDGFGTVDLGTMTDPSAVVVTPDGAQILVAGAQSDSIAVFARDTVTGAVTLQQVVFDGVGGVDGLDLVQALIVSPGGRFVYAAGLADDAIAIFGRDTESGELTWLGQAKNGQPGYAGLDGVRGLAMTPDGLFLFAASYNDDAVAIFRRDGLSGLLTELQVARNGVAGFSGLDGARALAVAPGGDDIYAIGELGDSIAVLSRVGQASCGTLGESDIADTVDIAVGGSVTYTVLGSVDSAATGHLINTVTVAMPAGSTNSGDASATDDDLLTPVASLAVTKTDGVTQAVPGTATVYLITVTNAGPSDAPASAVTDLLPVEIASATWTCQGSLGGSCAAAGSGGLAGELAALPAGGEAVFALAALIDPAATGSLVNTATVGAGPGVIDPVAGDNASTDTDLLVPSADLSLVKTVDLPLVEIGDPLQFSLAVTNNGPSVATTVTVIDLLPGGMSVTGAAGPGWVCTPGTSSVTCTLANLAPGGTSTIVIDANAPSTPGNYVNGATVSAGTGDSDASNNTGTVPFAVVVVDPPKVDLIDAGAGPLDEMATELGLITQIDVTFSEEMFDPAGDSDPQDVTNPSAYLLVEAGQDGLFATANCGAVVGDDITVTVDSAAYANGTSVATLGVHGGVPLTDGLFRLFVCGSRVEDLDGNPLDGNGDGTPGDDFIRHFRVRIVNLVERPHFDFTTDLDAWTLTAGGPADIVNDPLDADGFPLSGSARLQNLSGVTTLSMLQCIPVPTTDLFVLAGESRITAAPGSQVQVAAQAQYIAGTCAVPTGILSSFPTAPLIGDTGGLWRRFARALGQAPVGATAIRVSISAVDVPGAAYDVRLDNLSLVSTVFSDGFETGDSSRWSATVP
ncbi:MAG: beta-propeller fold lactonase family protein [Thermoanaerobaculia bacterium]